MPRKAPLRAVSDSDTIEQPKPKSLKDAAERGERHLLVEMRNKISDEVASGVPPHTLAPLIRQLREIDKEIRAFDLRAEQDQQQRGYTVDDTFDASAI